MICMNLSALLLIHTFFRTQRIIFMSWLLLGGLCIINRLCIFYLAFGAFIPFTNGTYTGSNFAQNPDYWPYSTAVALSAVFESVFLALASITFIRHIVLQLQLPKQQILNVMIMNFGGLKFLGLILMRFFSAGLIFRLLMNAWKADSLTSLSSCTLFDGRHECSESILVDLYRCGNCVLCDTRSDEAWIWKQSREHCQKIHV
ncbi:hypothetical protein EDD86DRAFT_95642 [Gorgonomyces haynaldii]|nr:hypothetical protein EDD86DRAFT_95642 [Gorgonomyces haynaldii]